MWIITKVMSSAKKSVQTSTREILIKMSSMDLFPKILLLILIIEMKSHFSYFVHSELNP